MYKATITVTLRPSILDPQGKAIQHALANLGLNTIDRVRVGKMIEVWIDEATEQAAESKAEEAARKLLANQVMEDFSISVTAIEEEQV